MVGTDRLGLIGKVIDGRYAIGQLIGEGGVGAVYRAEHTRLGRTVAIKFLHREYSKDHEALQRFFNEARAAATLGHTNIAESLDMGELPDGTPYLVLEFLDGRSLASAIQHAGRLSVRRSLRITRQIATGLEAAHENHIIHRDLKSENVFLTHRDDNPEHVKILDFGVARMLDRPSPTKPGHLVGTPDFMPPEQIDDPDNIDLRVDIYAAGVILYHMLSGHKPYGDTTPINTLLHRILHEEPAPLPDDIPVEVRRLVADAMARDRANRIASMVDLRTRIDHLNLGGPATPFPTSTAIRVVRDTPGASPRPASPTPNAIEQPPRSSSNLRWIAIGVPIMLLCGIGGYLATRGSGSSEAAKDPAPVAATSPAPAVAPTPAAPATDPAVEAAPTRPRVVGPDPSHHEGASPAAAPAAAPAPSPAMSHTATVRPAATPTPTATATPKPQDRHATDSHVATPPEVTHPAPTPTPALATTPSPASPTPPTAPANPVPAPATGPGAPQPKLDAAAIRTVVSSKLGAIQQCFERAKMDDMTLKGTVLVRIQLAANGAVTSAQVANSTLGSPSAERCMTDEISRWRLPAPGAPATINYPFAFH